MIMDGYGGSFIHALGGTCGKTRRRNIDIIGAIWNPKRGTKGATRPPSSPPLPSSSDSASASSRETSAGGGRV